MPRWAPRLLPTSASGTATGGDPRRRGRQRSATATTTRTAVPIARPASARESEQLRQGRVGSGRPTTDCGRTSGRRRPDPIRRPCAIGPACGHRYVRSRTTEVALASCVRKQRRPAVGLGASLLTSSEGLGDRVRSPLEAAVGVEYSGGRAQWLRRASRPASEQAGGRLRPRGHPRPPLSNRLDERGERGVLPEDGLRMAHELLGAVQIVCLQGGAGFHAGARQLRGPAPAHRRRRRRLDTARTGSFRELARDDAARQPRAGRAATNGAEAAPCGRGRTPSPEA